LCAAGQTAGLALLAALPAACRRSNAPSPPARIGYIRSAASDPDDTLGSLRQGLRDFGYVEGENLLIEYRFAEGHEELLPTQVQELVDLGVALIVLGDTRPIPVARQVTQTVPLVMMFSADPVGLGLVESLARPGGNLTGMTSFNLQLAPKRLELLREVVPANKTVAVLHMTRRLNDASEMAATQQAAEQLHLELFDVPVTSLAELDAVLQTPLPEHVTALYVLPDILFLSRTTELLNFAARYGLPAMYASQHYVESGGLMAYEIDRHSMYRRVGYYVDQILKGASPAELPIEQPVHFQFMVNMQTARSLGIAFSPDTLREVTRTIE
jgi:putative ABC transport system substrate-binding protein